MGTYVVGDIHGHFDEWISLKERIELDSVDDDIRFVEDLKNFRNMI